MVINLQVQYDHTLHKESAEHTSRQIELHFITNLWSGPWWAPFSTTIVYEPCYRFVLVLVLHYFTGASPETIPHPKRTCLGDNSTSTTGST
jgi:hypothetical protein